MPRDTTTHIGGDSNVSRLTPKVLTKQQFGRRLYNLMVGKGMNNAELARAAGVPRNNITTYINARSLPTPATLEKLAQVLGVSPEELLPNHTVNAITNEVPTVSFQVAESEPGKAFLRINRLVSTATGVKILELLDADRTNVEPIPKKPDAPAD